jgi:hypothetical protein
MREHLLTTIQKATKNITHAFLDHNGVKATMHIPLVDDHTLNTELIIPKTEQTRPTCL